MRISDWSSDVCSSDLAKQERTVPASTQVPRDAVQIDHAITRCHRQSTVETGPAILHGLALPTTLDLALRARPEPARGQLRCAGTHTAADVVTGDNQVRAAVVLAAQDDMSVRVVGVPVIDRQDRKSTRLNSSH